jgi:hypothetical protein
VTLVERRAGHPQVAHYLGNWGAALDKAEDAANLTVIDAPRTACKVFARCFAFADRAGSLLSSAHPCPVSSLRSKPDQHSAVGLKNNGGIWLAPSHAELGHDGAMTHDRVVQEASIASARTNPAATAEVPAPTGWIYEHTADNSARFVLGTVGANPLVCFGVNPSTATPNNLDTTLRRIRGYAARNEHDSWVMLNLYPQRSTDPAGMHLVYLPALKAENERHIAELVDGRKLTLVAAWGEPITTRGYLHQMLEYIVSITASSSCDWKSIGGLTAKRHPRHPSRGVYLPLQRFDMDEYLEPIRPKPIDATATMMA